MSCPRAQALAGRCAGRNKEDAASLLRGLQALRASAEAEAGRGAARAATQARSQEAEVQLAAALGEQASMKAAMERMQARARLPRAAPGTPAPCPARRLCSGARLRRARLRARGAAPRAARRHACSRCTSTRFPRPPVSVWCSPHQGARRARQRRRPAVGAQQRRAARRRSSWRPGRQRRRRGRRRRSSWPWPASARARSGAGAVPDCSVAMRRLRTGPQRACRIGPIP